MWVLLTVVFCAVCLAETNDTTEFSEDFGPLRFHTKSGELPEKQSPLRWEGRRATQKALAFLNFIKTKSAINPLKISKPLGPYNIDIPEVKFLGNLTLENLVITGFKDSSVDDIEVHLLPPRIDINVSVPAITAAITFNVEAVFDDVPLQVHGDFSATILDLDVSGAIGLIGEHKKNDRLQAGSVYQLDSADFTIDIKDLQVHMNMNQYADEFKLIIDQFYPHTEQIIEDNHLLRYILVALNEELEAVPMKRIGHYLLGTAELSSDGLSLRYVSKKKATNARKHYYGK